MTVCVVCVCVYVLKGRYGHLPLSLTPPQVKSKDSAGL